MREKKTFYTEAAYFLGLVILAFGTALMERADFGMSMVVAPAYLVHLKLSQIFPWFSFGVSEYCLQAVLLILLGILMRRFRPIYLFSFVTAFLYGIILDAVIALAAPLPCDGIVLRGSFFLLGMGMGSIGVAMLFHTYIAPEAYELLVKEVSSHYGFEIGKTKTVYDCCSCVVSVLMSFAFFGLWHFEGVKLGTVVCALINGRLIAFCGSLFEKNFEFRDGLKLRSFFA